MLAPALALGREEDPSPTFCPQGRPWFHVYDPLESSLQALDSDSSLLLRLLGHRPAGSPALPSPALRDTWTSCWDSKAERQSSVSFTDSR